MAHIRQSFMYVMLAATTLAAAACGGTPSGGQDASAAPSASSSPSATTPPTEEPGQGSDAPVPVTTGKVTVTLGTQAYSTGAIITVTIANGLDRAVYSEDFKTACTIVTVQRLNGGVWTDITGCKLGRPTMTVAIDPGQGKTLQLDPNSFHLTGGRGGPAFPPGTYRVQFTYRYDRAMLGEESLAAYSAQFTIK
jgi:hypothetical protein